MDAVSCPACGGVSIKTQYDMWHDLDVFVCETCGESYAADRYDVERLGIDGVFREWRSCFEVQRRLTS